MNTRSRISPARCALLSALAFIHILVFSLLGTARFRPRALEFRDSLESSSLQMLTLTQRPDDTKPGTDSHSLEQIHPRLRPSRSRVRPSAEPAAISLTPQFEDSPAVQDSPPVDWSLEGERAAELTIKEMAQKEKRRCDDSEVPNPLLPKCDQHRPQFGWAPNPKKAGFIGVLPYVRLGKQCILGLGFFGCAVGKLPDANSHLLDHMDDPDRSRESVPDSPH